jgi:hypothetical protein
MESSTNAQAQPNNEEYVEERIIVELQDSDGAQASMLESGLLRISSIKKLRREDKKLKKDFQFWMPKPSQIKKRSNKRGHQIQTKSVEYNDAVRCMEYVKTCGKQRVVLMRRTKHSSQNSSDFLKSP